MLNNNNDPIKSQMIYEALVIISSVEWAGLQINKLISRLDNLQNTSMFEEIDKIDENLRVMQRRLQMEDENINNYFNKYKSIISGNSGQGLL